MTPPSTHTDATIECKVPSHFDANMLYNYAGTSNITCLSSTSTLVCMCGGCGQWLHGCGNSLSRPAHCFAKNGVTPVFVFVMFLRVI